jgi:hypothetical protein
MRASGEQVIRSATARQYYHPVTLVALSTLATTDDRAVEGLLALLDRELKTFSPSDAGSA